MSTPPLVLPYRSKPFVTVLAGLFFVGCAVILFRKAQTNDRGLVLNGIIHFEPAGATVFYWCLVALSLGFVLFAILGLARSRGAAREVVLDDRTLSAPRNGLSGTIVTVPLATITRLQISEISGQRFLNVFHVGGRLSIPASMLPSRGDLDLLAQEIDRRQSAVGDGGGDTPPPQDPIAPPRPQFGRRGL